ncbi:hypothetical protein GCM10017673_27250 [Streptosporangium violaceochromogenes]|nr:hypothetical protein GCM10017673_27250 [Streptosporangium violaceochromogenes]
MLALKRIWPLIACAGIAVAVVAMIVGQLAPDPSLNPLDLTIGEYALLERGGVTEFSMVSLGVASFALVVGLRAARAPVGTAAERLMLVWSAALTAGAVVPGTVAAGTSGLAAQAHHYVLIAGFLAMPVAGALMVTRLGADERWRGVARPVEWLALAGGFGVLAVTYVTLPGDRVLIGLAERVLLGAGIALVAVLAVRLAQLTWVRETGRASRAVLG